MSGILDVVYKKQYANDVEQQSRRHAGAGSLDGRLERADSLRIQIHDRLRAAILSGELAPGTAIIESEVATRLGASRTPVRDALRRLEAEGLLEPRGSRGNLVRELRAEELLTLFEIREALETLAARRAARVMKEADFAALDDLIDRMRSNIEDVDALERYDTAFHDHILAHADSNRLERMLSTLRAEIVTWRFMSLSTRLRRLQTIDEHVAMLAAIRSGDEAKITNATSRHIANARASVLLRMGDAAATTSTPKQRSETFGAAHR